ncbi:MAG TPA: prepilin-type N-terminal cleavage/methylation domain-containing protein [Geminicoccus sp.]|uniref:prepilin-type N-terminal cleavage/methylation domain-containing protein n=1 Tax=Geminicoccus sp. TaxID=2024832 RepID=UPI002CBE074B|nr:prepilin-type N-terminal cleavage/methylation domain-containing protein [Geminicoccus sp.]HWL70895.1 prepilin-type N-terminal cleavage/methylation domain-containing protein [Geminicoccus sp.]
MRHPEAGFTLIELLVAMTLLAVLATVVTSALGSTNLSILKGDTRTSALTAAVDLQQLLVREVGRARPYVPDRNGRLQPVFEASPDRLRFIAIQPEGRPAPVLQLVELEIDDLAGVAQLLLRKVPVGEDPTEALQALEAQAPIVLHRGGRYALRYFGAVRTERPAAWVAAWPPNATDLPQAVALAMTSPGALPMPEIVAPFPVRGAAICGEQRVECRLLSGSAL